MENIFKWFEGRKSANLEKENAQPNLMSIFFLQKGIPCYLFICLCWFYCQKTLGIKTTIQTLPEAKRTKRCIKPKNGQIFSASELMDSSVKHRCQCVTKNLMICKLQLSTVRMEVQLVLPRQSPVCYSHELRMVSYIAGRRSGLWGSIHKIQINPKVQSGAGSRSWEVFTFQSFSA